MYIVAIAWIYVVFMMSITEESVVAGLMTFALYGILPLTIVLYIIGTPQRKRRRAALAAAGMAAAEPASVVGGETADHGARVEPLHEGRSGDSTNSGTQPGIDQERH